MRELPIGKIPGIGPKTQEKLKKMGVVLCSDLWKFSISNLASKFGASGASLYDRSRGRSHSHISTGRERKSVSAERSYFKALETQEEMVSSLKKVYEDFLKRRHSQKNASQKEHHKIFVVMKFSDFKRTTHERITRSCEFDEFRDLAVAAFQRSRLPVRLIGLGLKFQVPSRKRSDSRQLKLFEGD